MASPADGVERRKDLQERRKWDIDRLLESSQKTLEDADSLLEKSKELNQEHQQLLDELRQARRKDARRGIRRVVYSPARDKAE
jgi:hypothetical protein